MPMQMDLTPTNDVAPGHHWAAWKTSWSSRTFILCSDCYTCTLQVSLGGFRLRKPWRRLKGIAFDRQEASPPKQPSIL
jgi:hypothetical protein